MTAKGNLIIHIGFMQEKRCGKLPTDEEIKKLHRMTVKELEDMRNVEESLKCVSMKDGLCAKRHIKCPYIGDVDFIAFPNKCSDFERGTPSGTALASLAKKLFDCPERHEGCYTLCTHFGPHECAGRSRNSCAHRGEMTKCTAVK